MVYRFPHEAVKEDNLAAVKTIAGAFFFLLHSYVRSFVRSLVTADVPSTAVDLTTAEFPHGDKKRDDFHSTERCSETDVDDDSTAKRYADISKRRRRIRRRFDNAPKKKRMSAKWCNIKEKKKKRKKEREKMRVCEHKRKRRRPIPFSEAKTTTNSMGGTG